MRRVVAALFVVPLMAVAACSGGGGSDAAETTKPSASAAPSDAASPTPSQVPLGEPRPATTADAAKLGVTVLGTSTARSAQEKAVVDAWMAYWIAVSATYDTLVAPPELEKFSEGVPFTRVLDYLGTLKSRGHRSVGWTSENVLKVVVSDDTALLRSCAENFSFEVDANGESVEEVTPFFLTTGQLTKKGDRWVVTSLDTDRLQTDCRS